METIQELKFEYKFITRYEILEKIAEQNLLKHKTNYSDVLNELGKDGWELVSVLQYSENSTYIFKRAKWEEKKAQGQEECKADTWNEEDEDKLKSCLRILYARNDTETMCTKWLKSLKQRMKEDERIRKELINYFTEGREFLSLCSFGRDEILAWLEKQANKVIDCPQNHQDSSRPNGCIVLEDFNGGEGFYKLNLDYLNKKQVEEVEEMIRTWNKESKTSEAIHEQKPNNKSKFNVDDWICNDACIVHIASIKDGMYYFDEGDGLDITFIDNNYHLWTIADAKDGDVLAEDSCIFIIQKLGDNNTAAKTYCTLYDDGDFDDGSILYFDIDSTKPATKEQRDFLFQKMHEAGYMWDSESKQLLSLKAEPCVNKQNSAWSEEDETILKNLTDYFMVDDCLQFKEGKIVKWLESLKQRVKGE